MKKTLLSLCLLCLLLFPACALGETAVASFYPIYLFALNLTDGVEGLEVHCLAEPGTGCLHDYQLSTGDMKALADADVFLINGAGMESYLDFALEAFPGLNVVDASEGIALLAAQDDDHEPEQSDHDHGEYNAHIWLDAQNAMRMVRNLAEGLMETFPDDADVIAANRDGYIARLEALDEELREGLAGLERRDIVTFHEAFPYFARAYGLNVVAVLNREPDTALAPRELAELVKLIREKGIPPLFTEPQYTDMAAQTLARETGAAIYSLNPIVTGPETDVPLTLYEDCMRENMQVLLDALQE